MHFFFFPPKLQCLQKHREMSAHPCYFLGAVVIVNEDSLPYISFFEQMMEQTLKDVVGGCRRLSPVFLFSGPFSSLSQPRNQLYTVPNSLQFQCLFWINCLQRESEIGLGTLDGREKQMKRIQWQILNEDVLQTPAHYL